MNSQLRVLAENFDHFHGRVQQVQYCLIDLVSCLQVRSVAFSVEEKRAFYQVFKVLFDHIKRRIENLTLSFDQDAYYLKTHDFEQADALSSLDMLLDVCYAITVLIQCSVLNCSCPLMTRYFCGRTMCPKFCRLFSKYVMFAAANIYY